jgi:hypothetical protein
MRPRPLSRPVLACLLAAAAGSALAQAQAHSIYTCIDAKGHRLTADRPIPECIDREQKELTPSGTVRRTIGPALTATERAAQEERDRKEAEERQRQADEKRVRKALLTRYPDQAAHDAERAKALQAAQNVINAGERRVAELQQERRKLNEETEFYKDPARWPPKLRRQIEDSDQQIAAQQRFVAAQREEKKRLDTQFDEELARLKELWAQQPRPTSAAASGPKKLP